MKHDWIHRPVLGLMALVAGGAGLASLFDRAPAAAECEALRGTGAKIDGGELSIAVPLDARAARDLALTLKGFALSPDASLRPLELRVERRDDTTLKASGALDALFPLRDRPVKVVFVVEPIGAEPPRALAELQARDDVCWFEDQLELDPRPLDARLLNFERLEEHQEKLSPVFTPKMLPRVRVLGGRSSDWTLRLRGADGSSAPLDLKTRLREPHILLEVETPLEKPGVLELYHAGARVETWPFRWSRTKEDYVLPPPADVSGEEKGWFEYYSINQRGRNSYKSGDYATAWKIWDEARILAEKLKSPTEVAGRYRSLAYLDLQNDRFDRAHLEIARAREISKAADDITGLVRGDYLEALLHERRSGPTGAMLAKKRYAGTIKTAMSNGDDEDADKFALLLASVLAEYGNAEDARAWLKSIAPGTTKTSAWNNHAVHRIYVERVAFERGDSHASAQALRGDAQSVLDELRRNGASPADRAHVLVALLRYDLELGDLSSAESHAEDLSAIPEEKLEYVRYFRPLILAELHLAQGRLEQARAELHNYQKRLENRRDGAAADARSAIDALLGQAYLRQGDADRAEQMFVRAIAGVEDLARTLSGPRARARYRIQFQYAERGLSKLLIQRGERARAFEWTEQIRVRELLDLSTEAALAQAPEAFEHYVEAYFDLEASYPADCEDRPRQESVECHNSRATVGVALEELHRAFWADRVDPRSANRFRVLEILRSSTLSGSAVLSVADLPDKQKVSFWVEAGAVRAHVSNAGEDPIQPWLADLARVDRVYVAPNQPSTYALPLRIVDGGIFLGAKIPVLMLAYSEPAHRRATRGSAPLIIADPDGTLIHAREEGNALFKRWPNARLLRGESATRAAVLSNWNAEFLHFAGHAELIAEDIWRPTLRLAGGETIALEDVLAAPPNAKLVVLNACGSGAFLERGHIGLPDAFARAADYVLASSARALDDHRARTFVADFYEAGAGDPPEAYRRALEAAGRRGEKDVDFRLWAAVGAEKK